MNTVVFMIK